MVLRAAGCKINTMADCYAEQSLARQWALLASHKNKIVKVQVSLNPSYLLRHRAAIQSRGGGI